MTNKAKIKKSELEDLHCKTMFLTSAAHLMARSISEDLNGDITSDDSFALEYQLRVIKEHQDKMLRLIDENEVVNE